jgi:hypothetical protein
MSSDDEPVHGKTSEAFHFFVNRLQQFGKDRIQFFARSPDRLIAEFSDSIVKTSQSHTKMLKKAYSPNWVFRIMPERSGTSAN